MRGIAGSISVLSASFLMAGVAMRYSEFNLVKSSGFAAGKTMSSRALVFCSDGSQGNPSS